MRIDLTRAQVRALEAAAAFRLWRPGEALRIGSHLGIWRIADGPAVTMSAFRLIDKKLITIGEPDEHGSTLALITSLGQAVLDELASRGPNPDTRS